MSWAQQLEDRVREQAFQQGLQQGREEEHQRMLAKQRRQVSSAMQARFGPLTEEVFGHIQDAAEDELDRLLLEVVTAPSLQALFR
jgi:hypothetical protein